MGPSGTIWSHIGPYVTIRGYIGLNGAIWGHMVPSGVIWNHTKPYRDIWGHMASWGFLVFPGTSCGFQRRLRYSVLTPHLQQPRTSHLQRLLWTSGWTHFRLGSVCPFPVAGVIGKAIQRCCSRISSVTRPLLFIGAGR